jgi:octaprenyl-diphosphate synthase
VNGTQTKRVTTEPFAADLLTSEMVEVENRLTAALNSREPLLTEITHYLIDGGGKRVRPMISLAIFKACGGIDPDKMIDVAVALELIHSATLLHDDIIDDGELRRGRISAHLKFGSAETLVAGDFLFSKAFAICGRFDDQVVRWASDACIALTEGEIMQGRFRRNPAVTAEDYREIIYCKTACLFEQGAQIAAYLAGCSNDTIELVGRCGRSIGMAVQLSDDLLDIDGNAEHTGKPIGIDLRDGNPSFPIVLALPTSAKLREIWSHDEPSEQAVQQGLLTIQKSGALDVVRKETFQHSETALDLLLTLPESPFRESIVMMIHELQNRVS